MTQRESRPLRPLADVVSEVAPALQGALAWVGMEGIETLVRIGGQSLPARAQAFVNLQGEHLRGIHMSRLYRGLDRHLSESEPTPPALRALLEEFLHSHRGLSDRARVQIAFQLPLRRPALTSGLTGWRLYPVTLSARLDARGFRGEATVEVQYSSTCPGSAALARQLVQRAFDDEFGEAALTHQGVHDWLGTPAGVCATPHAQRSLATVTVRWQDQVADAPLAALIDALEAALGTPVQTAVKRDDEQEFARLNGEHPMYCEDAVRRLRAVLETFEGVADWRARAAHLESLHPHDAVALAVKGVDGGYED